jgi:seryl-tRNA synthetase
MLYNIKHTQDSMENNIKHTHDSMENNIKHTHDSMENNIYAENLKTELIALNDELWNIKQKINEIKKELESTCKHTNCVEEYDDDFHKPGLYNRCLTCDFEFKKR